MKERIEKVISEMASELTSNQLRSLQKVLVKIFAENETAVCNSDNNKLLELFLAAKKVEGCSSRTIKYYKQTAEHMFSALRKSLRTIST